MKRFKPLSEEEKSGEQELSKCARAQQAKKEGHKDSNVEKKCPGDERAESRKEGENQKNQWGMGQGASTKVGDVVGNAKDPGLDTKSEEAAYTKMSPQEWATLQRDIPHMAQDLQTAILQTPELEYLPAGLFTFSLEADSYPPSQRHDSRLRRSA